MTPGVLLPGSYHGDPKHRAKIKADYFDVRGDFDVCLTTYESAIAEKGAIGKVVWRYLIIDEAHRIKNETYALTRSSPTLATTLPTSNLTYTTLRPPPQPSLPPT